MTHYTLNDTEIVNPVIDDKYRRITVPESSLIEKKPWWMLRGLSESTSGYGAKLNSGYMIKFEGRIRRIYVCQFSNAGTCYIKYKGSDIIVDVNMGE